MNLTIRKEKPGDASVIHDVTKAAFLDAPHTGHTEQFIVDALRAAGVLTLSLVAEDESGIVGHVALSPVTISDGAKKWFGLGPISVLPQKQGLGIGSKLMLAAIDELRNSGANGCVLLGDPAFYSQFGFKPVSELVLPDVPPEYFQALLLSGVMPSGVVTYHEAFLAES